MKSRRRVNSDVGLLSTVTTKLVIILLTLASAVGTRGQEKPRCPEKVTYDRFKDKTTELCTTLYSRNETLKMFSINLIIEYTGQKPQPPFKVSLSLFAGTGEYPGYPTARFNDVKSIFILTDTCRGEAPLTEYKRLDMETRHFVTEIATMPLPQQAIDCLMVAKTVEARLGGDEIKFNEDALKAFQDYGRTIFPPVPRPKPTPSRRRRSALTSTQPNKSLDASGGSVFRIMTGPAMLE
jgi:hypothetical protein